MRGFAARPLRRVKDVEERVFVAGKGKNGWSVLSLHIIQLAKRRMRSPV